MKDIDLNGKLKTEELELFAVEAEPSIAGEKVIITMNTV